LYYTNDSSFVADSRAHNKYALSGKTPLCTDTITINHITKHCTVHSPASLARLLADTAPATPADPAVDATQPPSKDALALALATMQEAQPTFLVSQVYDAKPVEGAEFVGEVDYDEVYARGVRDKDWDTEAIMEEVSSEEEEIRVKKAKRAKEEKKAKGRKIVVAEGDETDDSSDGEESADQFVSRLRDQAHPIAACAGLLVWEAS